jgi:hypothetical protein
MLRRILPAYWAVNLFLAQILFAQTQINPSHASVNSPQRVTRPSAMQVPLMFEQNRGQAPGQIQFLSHSGPLNLALTDHEAILNLSKLDDSGQNVSLSFSWLRSQADMKAVGEQELAGRTNYLVGDQKDWIRGIPNFGRVRYRSIYPGVDLIYYGNGKQLEYDLELQPGADASRIALTVDGAAAVLPQSDGSLQIQTALGDVEWQKPVAYQVQNGKRTEIAAAYRMDHAAVRLELGSYDHTLPLTIDPTLSYAALIGPVSSVAYIAADASGSAYLLNSTTTPAYPTTAGSYMPKGQFSWGPPSLYSQPWHPLLAITKFSPDGSTLVYSTYLGGSQYVCNNQGFPPPRGNYPGGIAVDSSGNAIIAGATDDSNFPVTPNAAQPGTGNCQPYSMTLSKLSADGSSLLYGTYLYGTGYQSYPYGVAVDPSDNLYIGGEWSGPAFSSTLNLSSCTNCINIFAAKVNASGSLGYSVLLGGQNSTSPSFPVLAGVAVDSSGDLYMTGNTTFTLPTVNALQPTKPGGQSAFVGELNPSGTAFKFLTYLGGSSDSVGTGIALDPSANIYVTGFTLDNNFPITNAYQSTNKAYPNANGFITEYSPNGQSYIYSTYLGGPQSVALNAITVGPDGKASVIGMTQDTAYPITPDAFQPVIYNTGPTGTESVFSTLAPGGSSLYYSTYLEGNPSPNPMAVRAESIAATPSGDNVFVGGETDNVANVNDFPVTPGAYDNPNAGVPNGSGYAIEAGFAMNFCMSCTSPANITISAPLNGAAVTSPVNFVASAYDPNGVAALQIYVVPGTVAYQTNSDTINTNLNIAPGNYNVVIQEWSKTGSYIKKTVSITVQNAAPTVTITSPAPGATVSDPVQVSATAKVNGTGKIVAYRVYAGNGDAVYTSNTSTLNANVTLPQGPELLTVVAYDSTGAAGAAKENITVSGGSGGDLVTITSPANDAVLTSPVTFTASATTTCTAGIQALQIYTDPGVLAYTAYGAKVSKSISLASGIYYGAVQAWDNCGGTFTSDVTFQVQ